MITYALRRLIELVPTVLILTIFVFVVMRLLPGDPIQAAIGPAEASHLTPEQRAALTRELGLDKSWPVQYVDWLKGVLSGDWGKTLVGRQPLDTLIRDKVTISLQVMFSAWLLA